MQSNRVLTNDPFHRDLFFLFREGYAGRHKEPGADSLLGADAITVVIAERLGRLLTLRGTEHELGRAWLYAFQRLT